LELCKGKLAYYLGKATVRTLGSKFVILVQRRTLVQRLQGRFAALV
jgi:hypothetical protein